MKKSSDKMHRTRKEWDGWNEFPTKPDFGDNDPTNTVDCGGDQKALVRRR